MNLNAEQILLTAVTLKLQLDAAEGQHVFVVGSVGSLGGWDSARAVPLVQDSEAHDVWTVLLRLPVGMKTEYRYIIKDKRGRVQQWEAHTNRLLYPCGMAMTVDDGAFGLSMSTRAVHVDQGWLVDDVSIRVMPGSRDDVPVVQVRDGVTPPVAPKLRVLYGDGWEDTATVDETGVYTFTAPSMELLGFIVDVHEDDTDERWGRAVIDASELGDLRGMLSRPILGPDLVPRGVFTCEFLVVKPFKHKSNTLASIWRSYWAPSETLKIGHRGSGASRSRPAVSENTILSMLTAAKLGASYVEFDVQLTRDNVPVVHHDFTFELMPRDDVEPIEIPIAQMHSAQLVNMLAPNDDKHARAILGAVRKSRVRRCHSAEDLRRVHEERRPPPPVSAVGLAEELAEESDSLDHLLELGFLLPRKKGKSKGKTLTPRKRPKARAAASPLIPEEKGQLGVAQSAVGEGIPLFENLFEQVPISVGFNVEIKYPLERRYEKVLGTQERNAFVDAILQVVFDCAGSRSIIFSSFDPDIVTLLANKQPRYPVFFLTEAGNKVRTDPRCNSLEAAIAFARSLNLRGVVVNALSLLKDPKIIGEIKQQQLLVFSFGGANNDEANVRTQKEQGIDGIIADKIIAVHAGARRKESISKWVASDHARVLPPSPISASALPSIM